MQEWKTKTIDEYSKKFPRERKNVSIMLKFACVIDFVTDERGESITRLEAQPTLTYTAVCL